MAYNSTIQWTDGTWNPITGCSRVSTGCEHCYAETLAAGRLRHHPSRSGLTDEHGRWNGVVRFNEEWLDQPLRWKRPRQIFVCAHGDLFHEDVPDEWIDAVFAVMSLAPQHVFQILTKRPSRMQSYMTAINSGGLVFGMERTGDNQPIPVHLPLPNVWLGTSIEDRANLWRTEALKNTPAAVRFLSLEPILEDLGVLNLEGIGWVIAGGESGAGARPMHPWWVSRIQRQCSQAGVPFFFKQWGEWLPEDPDSLDDQTGPYIPLDWARRPEKYRCMTHTGEYTSGLGGLGSLFVVKVGKKKAGRTLLGAIYDEMPAHKST